jgi:hypothetical protein
MKLKRIFFLLRHPEKKKVQATMSGFVAGLKSFDFYRSDGASAACARTALGFDEGGARRRRAPQPGPRTLCARRHVRGG